MNRQDQEAHRCVIGREYPAHCRPSRTTRNHDASLSTETVGYVYDTLYRNSAGCLHRHGVLFVSGPPVCLSQSVLVPSQEPPYSPSGLFEWNDVFPMVFASRASSPDSGTQWKMQGRMDLLALDDRCLAVWPYLFRYPRPLCAPSDEIVDVPRAVPASRQKGPHGSSIRPAESRTGFCCLWCRNRSGMRLQTNPRTRQRRDL